MLLPLSSGSWEIAPSIRDPTTVCRLYLQERICCWDPESAGIDPFDLWKPPQERKMAAFFTAEKQLC